MKFMPTFFRLFAVVVLALSLSSCEFEEVELGFPSSVTFTKAGGVKSISGDETFNYVDIHNYTTGEQGTIAPTDDALICITNTRKSFNRMPTYRKTTWQRTRT